MGRNLTQQHAPVPLLLLLLLLVLATPSVFARDAAYFLPKTYRSSEQVRYRVRQVPGDGSCLFHALAVSMTYLQDKMHHCFNEEIARNSSGLRKLAVEVLSKMDDTCMYIQDSETLTVRELVTRAAETCNQTPHQYCENMKDPTCWGGGPEIVALSNSLRRPIHVYSLQNTSREFLFSCMIAFGSPLFDNSEPIRLLCADPRFPNVRPGHQNQSGSHFLALFPSETWSDYLWSQSSRKLAWIRRILRDKYESTKSQLKTSDKHMRGNKDATHQAVGGHKDSKHSPHT